MQCERCGGLVTADGAGDQGDAPGSVSVMKLVLPLKREFFEAIQRGEKTEEYRLVTPYWCKRLEGRNYAGVVLTLGYPKRNDTTRRIEKPWRGYTKKTITHPHFGEHPVEVFAIKV